MEPVSQKKRVLILSEGFGAGHTQAAFALAGSLEQRCVSIETRVVELGSFLHPTLAPWIFSAYKKTISAQPKLYGRLYRSQYQKSLNPLTQLALHRIFYAQTAAMIRDWEPHAIVCTHPFPSVVVSRLKRAGLHTPLCTVITDYDVHGTWVSREVNKYMVSSEDVKHKLLVHGVAAAHVEITGIPVHPSFREVHDKTLIRQQFQLAPLPTVLIMGGGWGLIGGDSLSEHLVAWRDRIQFIFCLGQNEKALAKLAADPRYVHPHIHLLGFSREIDKLMEASDLLVTKPGGMTCSEGLAKAIPMLFYDPIPGQEEENVHYFTKHGFGEPIQSSDTISHWLTMLASRYSDVQASRVSNKNRNLPAGDGSEVILQMLG
ncbi:UDP-N-acetylglucosamine--LPS N-acetylglucosamine transferase [Paenibacillus pectinilyticus]|uniref:UDP-N-acetylglucosamine--LPS N-acetylglucosamine transferase n=1 Tax=Paenibacillus pectinilyticus TaxID=512399 RepID=A0A1C0ZSA2_9BACL|nr:glycosyltransferase [Paenibacillus pectinilyticus]OCT10946.1 UDP-N-acetylglucosamine--LPS N-acetylglucosamine transferase [Paenibacillus pectinilyticus]